MQLFSFFARPPKRKLAKRMVFSSPWAVLPNSTQLLLIFKFSFITFGRDDQWFSILLWLQKKSFKVLERNLTRNDWCTSKQSKSWEKIVKKKNPFGHTDICIEKNFWVPRSSWVVSTTFKKDDFLKVVDFVTLSLVMMLFSWLVVAHFSRFWWWNG